MCSAEMAHVDPRLPGCSVSKLAGADALRAPGQRTGLVFTRPGGWVERGPGLKSHQHIRTGFKILTWLFHISVNKLASLVLHFLICQRGKSKTVEDKRKQDFHVPNIQEVVVSVHTYLCWRRVRRGAVDGDVKREVRDPAPWETVGRGI